GLADDHRRGEARPHRSKKGDPLGRRGTGVDHRAHSHRGALTDGGGLVPEAASDLFRKEALDYHQGTAEETGSLLQISPAWLSYAYWLLVAVAIGGARFFPLGAVNECGTRPPGVRAHGPPRP